MTFIVLEQQGHLSGSPPHTCKIRSRQSGRMSRALHVGRRLQRESGRHALTYGLPFRFALRKQAVTV